MRCCGVCRLLTCFMVDCSFDSLSVGFHSCVTVDRASGLGVDVVVRSGCYGSCVSVADDAVSESLPVVPVDSSCDVTVIIGELVSGSSAGDCTGADVYGVSGVVVSWGMMS